MEAYSLFEVTEYIRRVIGLNFQEPIWVECEISQAKEVRGQVYLDLIETAQSTDEVIAQLQAVIWYKEFLFIKKKLGDLLPSILHEGVKVKIKASVDFHEKYGMKLVIEDIDPSYTMGMFELARQKLIERLRKENLIDRNSEVPLPSVIQKIAVISSGKAAGYQDFVNQLQDNIYEYQFDIELFPAAMQGQNTERDIVKQIRAIDERNEDFDIIAIVRGGGSKIDLSSFDNYNIAASIAKCSLPVLTGIGHDIDETITDLVSHSVLKTPTAVAEYLVEHNLKFESTLVNLEQELLLRAQDLLLNIKEELNDYQNVLLSYPREVIAQYSNRLALIESQFEYLVKDKLTDINYQLNSIEDLLNLMTPENILAKGFTLVRQNDMIVSSIKSLDRDSSLDIIFKDGELKDLKA